MKRTLFLVGLLPVLFSSCAHQVSTIGMGSSFNIGGGEYGSIRYQDGFFGNFVTKDGINFKVEIDSSMGISYDSKTNSYKGIKSMTYEIAPQITGYAVDLGKESPESVKAYYEALAKYYEYRTKKVEAESVLSGVKVKSIQSVKEKQIEQSSQQDVEEPELPKE